MTLALFAASNGEISWGSLDPREADKLSFI